MPPENPTGGSGHEPIEYIINLGHRLAPQGQEPFEKINHLLVKRKAHIFPF